MGLARDGNATKWISAIESLSPFVIKYVLVVSHTISRSGSYYAQMTVGLEALKAE